MIAFQEALEAVLKNTQVLAVERVSIEDCVGRVLKEDVASPLEMPPFDKAAVDGYAVRTSDVSGTPCLLKCVDCIEAGKSFLKEVRTGTCVKIMTGAPMPKNTDGVVMVEDTKVLGAFVEILRGARPGENLCRRGEDLKKGRVVLKKDKLLHISDVAILAAVGKRFVKVGGRPFVSVLNTGGEIVPVGRKLGKNKIYNSNGPMLSALLKSDGLEPECLGIVRDKPLELRKSIERGIGSDILLISGGVSMGDYDLVPDVLKNLGVRKIFHTVRMKPGKPLFFGKKNHTLVFGIPGNPVSNFLSYLVFVRSAIRKMAGYKDYRPVFNEGVVEKVFRQRHGRRHFALVKISKKGRLYRLAPVAAHGSADILSLSQSDGFMEVDEDLHVVRKNSKIGFITWKTI